MFQTASEIPEPLVCEKSRGSTKVPLQPCNTSAILDTKSNSAQAHVRFHLPTSPIAAPFLSKMKTTRNNRFTGRDFRHPTRGFPSAAAVGAASAAVPSLLCRYNLLQTTIYICRWLEAGPFSCVPARGQLRGREPCVYKSESLYILQVC